MATARRDNTVRVLGVVRRNRLALMTGTALQATVMLVLTLPAQAQPAPNARPGGGSVVAGAAAISQTTNNTHINQTTQRAAIDWRGFDVGSQQSVTFNQPSASAVALNRVTGPDPSQIAGRIDANGQIILVNQSGVNFYKGAQVNAAGVMVSAANISNANFMAGVMKFDQPGNPNAKIDNQGTITVQQAGLAALVAPQVANSGTISAKLGHVVLAGAKTATLDLFGDGLLSLDVSNQVMQAPVGPDGKAATALVTNTGTIIADGGTVQLTARAADGIVQNLVQAGGTISAATMGDQSGVVALNGVGGSIVVEGQLSAPGLAPGTKGGAIEVASNRNVVVAASAKIDASGAAGGGVAAIGTTLARARGGPGVTPTLTAANTVIRPGAKITADATNKGDGGRVTVLSTKATDMAGTITAKGGPLAGNGGFVEVSGDAGFSLTGTVDASAPTGALGSILLDPQDLFISAINPDNGSGLITPGPAGVPADGLPNATTNSWITPASITGLKGAVTIATTHDLTVMTPLDTTKSGITTLTLNAGNNLTENAKADISTAGSILLTAGNTTPTGVLTLNSPISSAAGSIFLQAHTGDIIQNAAVTANGPGQLVSLRTDGTVQFSASTASSGAQIQASGGTIEFGPATDNTFVVDGGFIHDFVALSYRIGQSTEPFTKNPGPKASTVSLGDIGGGGTMSFTNIATIDLQAHGAITETVASITNLNGTGLTLTGTGGTANLGAAGNVFSKLGPFTTNGDITLANQNALDIVGSVNAGTGALILQVGGGLTQSSGVITAGTLGGSANGASLPGANRIANLGSFTATGGLAVTNAIGLNIAGPVNTGPGTLALQIGGALTDAGGSITARSLTGTAIGNVSLLSPANKIGSIDAFSVVGGDLVVVSGNDLTLSGTLQANNLFFEVARAGGTLTLGFPADGPGLPVFLNSTVVGGRISLVADNYTAVTPTVPTSSSITTNAGTVELAPFSAINASVLGAGSPVVDQTLLNIIRTNGGTLDIGGFTNIPAGATTSAPRASSVNIAGALALNNATAATLRLDSTGSITQTGGPLTVANLTGSAGTFADLTQPANQVDTLGAFSTTAGFALVNNKSLLVTGPVTDTGAASTLALTTSTGGIEIRGNIDAGTGNVLISSAGNIGQIGPATISNPLQFTSDELHISGANVTLTAGGDITQNGYVAIIGNTQTTLTAGGNIAQSGATSPSGPFNNASGELLGSVIFGGDKVSVTAAHSITQSGDSRISANVDGSFSDGTATVTTTTGDLIQSGNAQIFADATTVHTGGNISQSGNARITADDADSDDTVSITTGGNLSQTGNASISAGTFGTLTLSVAGAISQSGGSITADTLTGSATGGAILSSPQNQVNNFGPFTATSGVIDLVDSIPLTINGALTARLIVITATGSLSLADDITTGGLANFTTVPTDPRASLGGAFFIVLPDAGGNSSFTANSHVASLDGTGTVMFVSMPPQGGNVGLTNLNATGTELLLNLGSGNASGQVDVGSLFVVGAGGQVNFTNSTVQGFTGSAAALAAQSSPPANPAYLVNGCAIGVGCAGPIITGPIVVTPPPTNLGLLAQGVSVSSGISNIVSSLVEDASAALVQSAQEANPRGVPILNPMRDLSGGPLRDRQSDPDLLLPNVSEKDY